MRLFYLSYFLFLVLLISPILAGHYSSNSLPSPQKDPGNVCRRGKKSAVCDPDSYLSESDADTIDGLINFINEGTNGFKKVACSQRGNALVGAQIAVAVFEGLPFGIGDKKTRAFQYAKDLHDRWGVGEADCQNGIVIIFAVKDRAMGFSIGRGVNNIFKDNMLEVVMSNMRPMLQDENYGAAIIQGVTDVGNILSGAKVEAEGSNDYIGLIGMGAVFAGIAAFSGISSARSNRRYRACKQKLRKIDSDRQKASAKKYTITSCPICLEDFPKEDDEENEQPENNDEQTREDNLSSIDEEARDKEERTKLVRFNEPQSQNETESNTSTPDLTADEKLVRIVTLPCGHKFHEDCIDKWFQGNGGMNKCCPICRQPIDPSENVIRPRTNNGSPSGWDVYNDEYNFRVRRTRHYYPDFITWSMINDWDRHRYDPNNQPMATSPAFVQVDPAVVAAAARASGSGGSSFSFGGGSSAGGGGGGGGW